MRLKCKKSKIKSRGFSLFEMIVVMAIVSYVAVVTFSSFPKMNSKLSLDLLTQDIALTIRQAQIYGTTVFGVGEVKLGGPSNFQAYGVSFPNTNMPTDGKYKYTLFADVPPLISINETAPMGGAYGTKNTYNEVSGGGSLSCVDYPDRCMEPNISCGDPKINNECLQRFSVSGRDHISAVCLNYLNDDNSDNKGITKDQRVNECEGFKSQTACVGNGKNEYAFSPVDIVFRRPKLQAVITTKCGNGYYNPTNVGVVLRSDSDETRVVVVWQNGQISIDR